MAAQPRRFAYYDRLSAESKRTYRKSDAIAELSLEDAPALVPLATSLREALGTGETPAVQRAASRLTRALLADLGASPADVEVLEVRPRGSDGELHGLYTWDERERPRIQVWMRTAAHGRVVAWKTFFRTLLHEVVHHVDIHVLELAETFHTRGFYQRETHLFTQLNPSPPPPPHERERDRERPTPSPKSPPSRRQLKLPFA